MNGLISQEQAFNELYNKPEYTLMDVLKFSVDNNFMDIETAENVKNNLIENAYNYAMSTLDFCPEDDIEKKIKTKVGEVLNYVDQSFKDEKNPYKSLNELLNSDPEVYLDRTEKKYNELKADVKKQIGEILKDYSYILENSEELKDFINHLIKELDYQISLTTSDIFGSDYRLMKHQSDDRKRTISEIDNIFKIVKIELDIIKHFDKAEVIHFLKSMSTEDISKNVTEALLYNYIFNAYYKDGSSIRFSNKMSSIIDHDVSLGFFTTEDALDIIENGEIKFSEEELEYIMENFIPTFKFEVEEKKYHQLFIKN